MDRGSARHERAERQRRIWVAGVGGVLVLVAVVGWLLVQDLATVRSAVSETRAGLEQLQRAIAATDREVDIEAVSRALSEADRSLEDAGDRVNRPLWTVAGSVPVVGDSVEVTRALVEVGNAAVDVGQVAVTESEGLLAGGLDIRVADGQLDLEPLVDAQQLLASLPLRRLTQARDRLAASEARWAPQQIVDGREETLAVVDATLDVAERADALFGALPGFLGADEPRRYFLGMQTLAEARGTGGLIGYWAVLHVHEGRFSLSGTAVYEALDDFAGAEEADAAGAVTSRIGELRGDPWDGVPTTPEFEARYAHTAASGSFSNVNVDPDLPTTARVALDLFTYRTGEELDGLILVDPIAMQLILKAIGEPLSMPSGLEDPALPDELHPSEFASFTMVDVYGLYGHGHGEERRLLLRGLADLAFARVLDGVWDGVAVSRAVAEASARRHLQVFSEDGDEQRAFSRVGITGELQQPEAHDLLAVTANNAVGGKQDVHLGHATQATIELSRPRVADGGTATVTRSATVRVEVDNPLPSSGMDTYIIGNCLVGDQRSRCFQGPPGWNRTWFSVWTPGDDTLHDRRDADGVAPVRVGGFHGLRVIDHYLETPPQGSGWFELGLSGPVPVSHQHGVLTYRLDWWRQAKATPDLLDVAITAPRGWQVGEVEVTGGGSGRGMGVHAGGVPMTAEVDDDGTATVTGTVTEDTSIEVRMERRGD